MRLRMRGMIWHPIRPPCVADFPDLGNRAVTGLNDIRDLIDIAGIHQNIQTWQINFDLIQLEAFLQRPLKGGCVRLGQWCAI